MTSKHVPKTLSRSSKRLAYTQASTALPRLGDSTRSGIMKEEPPALPVGFSRKTEHSYTVKDASMHSHVRTVNTQTAMCVALLVLLVVVMVARLTTT